MVYILCMVSAVCCIYLAVDHQRMRNQIKALRSNYDSLANFSLKHIQDHNHE